MTDSVDKLVRRCPRLGGEVTFAYCREHGGDNGWCPKVVDCWWEIFDVVDYLRQTLPPDEFERVTSAKPKPKLMSLVELIQQAQQRVQKDAEPENAPEDGDKR